MCLILFAYDSHPRYRLVMAANRDEFYHRPTTGLHEWPDVPGTLAGRDGERKGTWMGISRSGRLAAITNYRDGDHEKDHAPSRGQLVADYLHSSTMPETYLEHIEPKGQEYNGFNLIVGDLHTLWYYSNQNGPPRSLTAGVYGLSNHLLNTEWPKVKTGRQSLEDILNRADDVIDPEVLLNMLKDQTRPGDNALPDTGVGIELERMLSPSFITSPDYGTRSSSALLIDIHGAVTFVERTWKPGQPNPIAYDTRRFSFPAW